MTQQNAALVEQAAAAAQSLQDQAHHLAVAVSIFKLEGDDAKGNLVPDVEAWDVPRRPAHRPPQARPAARPKQSALPQPKKPVASDDSWEDF